jgi:hypothetical protein
MIAFRSLRLWLGLSAAADATGLTALAASAPPQTPKKSRRFIASPMVSSPDETFDNRTVADFILTAQQKKPVHGFAALQS